jgi:hypothetical protein
MNRSSLEAFEQRTMKHWGPLLHGLFVEKNIEKSIQKNLGSQKARMQMNDHGNMSLP